MFGYLLVWIFGQLFEPWRSFCISQEANSGCCKQKRLRLLFWNLRYEMLEKTFNNVKNIDILLFKNGT